MILQSGVYTIRRFSIVFACFSALLSSNLSAVSLYKWIDAEGNVSYQDTPPPVGQAFEEKSFADKTPSSSLPANSGSRLPVSLYISNDCANCNAVRTILEMNKVPYKQYLTDFNKDIQQELFTISGSNKVPAVVIGKQVVDKLDRRSLESALRQGGHPWPPLIIE